MPICPVKVGDYIVIRDMTLYSLKARDRGFLWLFRKYSAKVTAVYPLAGKYALEVDIRNYPSDKPEMFLFEGEFEAYPKGFRPLTDNDHINYTDIVYQGDGLWRDIMHTAYSGYVETSYRRRTAAMARRII